MLFGSCKVLTRLSRGLILLVCCGCFFWGFASVVMAGNPVDLYSQHIINGQTAVLVKTPPPSPTASTTPSPTPTPTQGTGGNISGGGGTNVFVFVLGGLGLILVVTGIIVYGLSIL